MRITSSLLDDKDVVAMVEKSDPLRDQQELDPSEPRLDSTDITAIVMIITLRVSSACPSVRAQVEYAHMSLSWLRPVSLRLCSFCLCRPLRRESSQHSMELHSSLRHCMVRAMIERSWATEYLLVIVGTEECRLLSVTLPIEVWQTELVV